MSIKGWLFGGEAGNNLPTQGANYNQTQGYLQNALGGADGRIAPQANAAQLAAASQLAGGPQDQARGQMQGVASHLQGIMSGNQAGAGELGVNRQVGQATAAQQAAARMSRGANSALAARNAARNTADIGVAGAGQAAMAQMQDQQGATGQLGGLLQGMRGQDIDFAGQNANLAQQRNMMQGQFDQQTGLANMQSKLQQMGMNDARSQSLIAQMMGMDAQQLQAEMMKQQLNAADKGNFGNILQLGGGLMAGPLGQGIAGKLFGGKPK